MMKIIYSILMAISAAIYSFVSYIYQVFLVLASGAEILDGSVVQGFISRVYVVLGVVVLFLVAYSLLKSMVNPDEALKGKKSPVVIIRDVIISIVLIAFIPTIFDFAFDLQNSLLTNNTIGKIVLGTSGDNNSDTINQGGYTIASEIWKAFMIVNPPNCDVANEDSGNCDVMEVDGKSYKTIWEEANENRTFLKLTAISELIADGKITYIFILDFIVGLFVVYVMASYCIDMALRLIKLAVYELIAPVPILSRIIPNEQASKMFSNWVKATISTFLEVFIRIAIMFFVVMVVSTLATSIDNFFTGFTGSETSLFIKPIALGLLIFGLVMFIKQAPEIIKELTGLDSGKYGKSLIRGVGMMAASLGGGATAIIRSNAGDKKNNPDMSIGRRAARALAAGAQASVRGVGYGSKVSKFGEMPKAAGKASSKTLDRRSALAAASPGGSFFEQYKSYYGQKRDDNAKRVKDWIGGTADELKGLKKLNEDLLKQISAIKTVAEDYIGKHEFEYFAFDDINDPGSTFRNELKGIEARMIEAKKKSVDQSLSAADRAAASAEFDAAKNDWDAFAAAHISDRLDVVKAKKDDISLSHEDRARAEQLYGGSRKKALDDFASYSGAHDAGVETAKVETAKKTLADLIKENQSAPTIQYAISDSDAAKKFRSTKPELKALSSDALKIDDVSTIVQSSDFIKNLKKTTEYVDQDIGAQIAENERREARRKAASGDDKK